jgi:hypothetical protein
LLRDRIETFQSIVNSRMIYITLITFTSWLLTLTVGQNLVLIGGNLRVDNAIVWEKMVKLAVSKYFFMIVSLIAYFPNLKPVLFE